MHPIHSPYLSTRAAARRLHLSRTTLLRAAHHGAIVPAFHTPGGALRFRVADIEAYACQLAGHTPAPHGSVGARAGDRA